MTRDDVLKLFPDATDEQITNLLNQNNSEVAKEKNKANQYKDKANSAEELQKDNAIRDQREAAMTNFKITADQAKSVVKDDGSLDYESLGKIISEKETASAKAKEEEIANNSTNPGGGSATGGNGDDKTEAEKVAENIGKSLAGVNESAKSIVESYML